MTCTSVDLQQLPSHATTGIGNPSLFQHSLSKPSNGSHNNAPVNNSFNNSTVTSIIQATTLPQAKAASGENVHSNSYNGGSTLSTIADYNGMVQQAGYALASHNASLHNPTTVAGLNNREEPLSSKPPYACAPPLESATSKFGQQDAPRYAVSAINDKIEHSPIPTHPQVLAVTTQLHESLYSPKTPPYTPLGLKPFIQKRKF